MIWFYNFISFYIVWWATAFLSVGRYSFVPLLLVALSLLIHFRFFVRNIKHELFTIFSCALLGFEMDFFLHSSNIIVFADKFYIWLIPMWIAFGMTTNFSLSKIIRGKLWILIPLAFVGGPLSYIAASGFHLVEYDINFFTVTIHGMIWVVYLFAVRTLTRN